MCRLSSSCKRQADRLQNYALVMENLNRTNLWIAVAIVSQFAWAGAVIACHDNNSPLERNEEPNAVVCEPQRQPGLDERGLLILSMMYVESRFDPLAEGGDSDTGILQITPVYVREANRILGREEFTLEDARDIKRSLDMFDVVQGEHNGTGDWAMTVYWHNKSGAYRDRVVQAYNLFLGYERMREVVVGRYGK